MNTCMSTVTNSDSDFLLKQWRTTVTEFKNDYDKWQKHTLGDYIAKCAEIVVNQIKAKVLNIEKSEISSYLFKELNKEEIVVSDRTIRRNLPEPLKRNYSISDTVSESRESNWETVAETDVDLIEKDQFDHFRINGKVQENKPERNTKDVEQTWDSEEELDKPEPLPVKNFLSKQHQNYLLEILRACDDLADIVNEFIKKGQFDPNIETDAERRETQAKEFAEIVEKVIKDPKKDYTDIKGKRATIATIAKMTDYRNKINEFMKIKAIILEATTFNLAKVAKMLSITPKHLSKNIIRNKADYQEKLKWFETVYLKVPRDMKKGETVKWTAWRWFIEQLARKDLELEMKQP